MKNLLLFAFVFVFVSCRNRNTKKDNPTGQVASAPHTTFAEGLSDGHNAHNSLNYAGIYEVTTPCADCPGIDVVITLDYEGNYIKEMICRGKRT